MTGTPPPPAQTTTAPDVSSRRTTRVSTIRSGRGEGTTRRQYCPSGFDASSRVPRRAAGRSPRRTPGRRTWWASSKAGSAAETRVWLMTAATCRPGSAFCSACEQPVADHALGLGAEDVERVRPVELRVGGALQGEQADLRAVAVGDDELVLLGERRPGRGRPARRWPAGRRRPASARARSRALPPRATTMRISVLPPSGPERGDHDRLDRVHPVLGLVEDDRVRPTRTPRR